MIETPYWKQKTNYTCGPTALEIVLAFYGDKLTQNELAKLAETNKDTGTDHKPLINAARKRGFYCYVHRNATIHLVRDFIHRGIPVLVNYVEPATNEGHYSVVVGFTHKNIIMNDPYFKKGFRMKIKKFEERWYDCPETHKYKRWILVLSPKKFDLGRQYEPTRAPSSKARSSSRR
jgi:ABC-type bacteriocin/lantibiotic exporter with double-glycine peptidase domain